MSRLRYHTHDGSGLSDNVKLAAHLIDSHGYTEIDIDNIDPDDLGDEHDEAHGG